MGIDALCALPVETLAAKDCLMFLWATFPMLPEALRLIQAWGFTFKTVAFVWLKRNKKSPTWFYSKKPDITREKIIELAGDLPRAELFARQKTPGWDVWGNEVDSDFSLSAPETR